MNLELELACRLSISSISFRGLGVRGMLVLLVCLSVGLGWILHLGCRSFSSLCCC
jgi:hypothetical protein